MGVENHPALTIVPQLLREYRNMNRMNFARLSAAALALSPAFAFAQGGSFDTATAVTTIGTGVAAVAAIGLAMLGVKVVKKVWNKIG